MCQEALPWDDAIILSNFSCCKRRCNEFFDSTVRSENLMRSQLVVLVPNQCTEVVDLDRDAILHRYPPLSDFWASVEGPEGFGAELA